jgi:hypothetical protein
LRRGSNLLEEGLIVSKMSWLPLVVLVCACERTAPPPDSSSTATADSAVWVVTATSFGPIRFGMSLAEANAAFDGTFAADISECDYAKISLPAGTRVMIESGRVARVDVTDSSAVTTAEGARIGDSEERIQALYPGRVTVQPHKYTNGHYLVVKPAAGDTMSQIIFETDGARVTRFRAGVLPPVAWVEGCA